MESLKILRRAMAPDPHSTAYGCKTNILVATFIAHMLICSSICCIIYTINSVSFCVEGVDDGKKCSKARESIKDHFTMLTTSFPMDNLLADLYSKDVINDDEKEVIKHEKLRKEKVNFLFDEVIIPDLKNDGSTKFDSLIKVMKDSDDHTAKHLANKLLEGT